MSLEYDVHAETLIRGLSTARTADAQVYFDTHPQNTPGLMNPAELLLSAFAACVLKNIERYGRILPFDWQKAALEVHGVRQDTPPRLIKVTYILSIWTPENAHRVALLHRNLQKFGTIYNTVAAACEVNGEIRAFPPDPE